MKLLNYTKFLLIISFSLNCYSQQLSDIPAGVMQKSKSYCNGLSNINNFTDRYKFDLANSQQIDPSTIRVHKAEFSPSLFRNSDDSYQFNHFTGFCKVTFIHAKGVHYDSFRLPVELDYKYNFTKREIEPPQEESRKDYRADFPNLYTPKGMIRNKRGDLLYY